MRRRITRRTLAASSLLAAVCLAVEPATAGGPAVGAGSQAASGAPGTSAGALPRLRDVRGPGYPRRVPQMITTLTLRFTIGMKGRVDGAQAIDENFGLLALERNGTVSADAAHRLRNAATEALERWRYDAPASRMTAFVRFEFVPGATGHVIWHAASPPPPVLTEEASIGGRTSRLVRVGGSVPAPKRTTHVDPAYPSIARSARIEGTLALKLVVNDAGDVVDARPLRSIPIFDDAAVRAARAWKYERLLIDGKPAAFVLVVAIVYALDTPTEMRGVGVVVDPSGAP